MNVDREQYERDLAERQRQHLERIRTFNDQSWRPCMHDNCPACCGTGVTSTGVACIHMIACPCPRCTPQCMVTP